MNPAFIDNAVVTAIQDDLRSRAERRTRIPRRTMSIFSRWDRSAVDSAPLRSTARPGIASMPRATQGAPSQ